MTGPNIEPRFSEAEWREAKTPDNEVVRYHVVTDDTRGRVSVPGGTRELTPGDVIVPAASGDVYYVYGPGEFGYTNTDDDDSENGPDYNPGEYGASSVRSHIDSLVNEGNIGEAHRIVEAERNGSNRKSAIPQSYVDWENSTLE